MPKSPLTPEQFQRIEQVYERLVPLSVQEKQAYLESLDSEEPRILEEVKILLDGDPTNAPWDKDISHLRNHLDGDSGDKAHSDDVLPETIGPYRIKRLIGEGGMGLVYLARQTAPVDRDVAVKVVRWGIDSKAVLSRFLAERQVLATLTHPGIASVLDAGTTDQGRPYFVMEYVDGKPLNVYCRSTEVSLQQRLMVFADICDAVQHAHQKGIIHRDLKPSNLLVVQEQRHQQEQGQGQGQDGKQGERQDRPFVKIIDFGIAKSTSQPFLQESLYTQMGELIGTPQYMSPEQASLGSLDVDTRSDVYTLGVVLYELLVGEPPLDTRSGEVTFDELLRSIRETDAPRPSTRAGKVSQKRNGATEQEQLRRTRSLKKLLRGDLDSIVQKALEKDRNKRYSSAAALGDDIRRHLANEPVLASPPSRTYRTAKFVRRHKLSVSLAAAVLAALIVGLISSSVLLLRAQTAEKEARSAEERAVETLGFLSDLFQEANPKKNPGPDLTAKELLRRGLASVDDELADQPAVRRQVLLTLGEVHRNVGLYDEAESAFRSVVTSLGATVDGVEAAKPDPAALKTPLSNEQTMTLVHALAGVAKVHRERAELDASEAVLHRAIAIWKTASSPDETTLASLRADLGQVLNRAGRPDDALVEYQLALDLHLLHPDDPPLNVATSYNNLGVTAARQGDFEKAQRWLAESLSVFEQSLEPGHASLATLAMNLSYIYRSTGRLDRAIEAAQKAVDTCRASVGGTNPLLADALHNLGSAAMFRGRFDLAIASFEEGMAITEESLSKDNDRTMFQLTGLARALQYDGQFESARQHFARVVQQKREISEHPDKGAHLASALRGQAIAARNLGLFEASRELAEELSSLAASDDERTAGYAAGATLLLAALDVDTGQFDSAKNRYQQAMEQAECTLDGAGSSTCPLDATTQEFFRAAYWANLGEPDKALQFLEKTFQQKPLMAWSLLGPDFDQMRNTPGFREFQEEFERRAGL